MLFTVRNKKVFTVDPVTQRVRITPEDLNQISEFTLEAVPSLPEAVPAWYHFEVAYTALAPAVAALTNDIELVKLPAGSIVHAAKLKHGEAFTGGLLSAYTLSLGVVGDLDRYSGGAACNVFDAPDPVNYDIRLPDGGLPRGESHEAEWSLRVAATATGSNLNAATAGYAEIWLLLSVAGTPDE